MPVEFKLWVTKDDQPLLWTQPTPNTPVLTVANYMKWYRLYLVMPDGMVQEVSFEELEQHTMPGESPYCDHVPNPMPMQRLATRHNWLMHEEALEMVIGRWETEVKNTYREG